MSNKTNNVLKSILKTAVCFLDQSGETANDARERIASGFDRASDRISDFGERASDRISDVGDRVRSIYRGDDHTMRSVLMFAAGIAVGACAGMLLAPASGEETRGAISDKVEEFRGQVRNRVSRATGTE